MSTRLNGGWLLKKWYKGWLLPVNEDSAKAKYKLCMKIFSLSKKGEKAGKSHSLGKKHRIVISKLQGTDSLTLWLIWPVSNSANVIGLQCHHYSQHRCWYHCHLCTALFVTWLMPVSSYGPYIFAFFPINTQLIIWEYGIYVVFEGHICIWFIIYSSLVNIYCSLLIFYGSMQ